MPNRCFSASLTVAAANSNCPLGWLSTPPPFITFRAIPVDLNRKHNPAASNQNLSNSAMVMDVLEVDRIHRHLYNEDSPHAFGNATFLPLSQVEEHCSKGGSNGKSLHGLQLQCRNCLSQDATMKKQLRRVQLNQETKHPATTIPTICATSSVPCNFGQVSRPKPMGKKEPTTPTASARRPTIFIISLGDKLKHQDSELRCASKSAQRCIHASMSTCRPASIIKSTSIPPPNALSTYRTSLQHIQHMAAPFRCPSEAWEINNTRKSRGLPTESGEQ